jgi:hypothetical protein
MKRIKLSVDNLLSHEMIGSSNSPKCNSSHQNSPAQQQHNVTTSKSTINCLNNSINTTSTTNISGQTFANNKSSNNLLNSTTISNGTTTPVNINTGLSSLPNGIIKMDTYDSPSSHSNHRLSINNNNNNNTSIQKNNNTRNSISNGNNNLSTNLSSGSILDVTTEDMMSVGSPFDKQRDSGLNVLNSASSAGGGGGTGSSKKMSKRSQRIYELYETEKRFVNILHTIIFYFKEPIEATDQVAGPILDQTETKEIFGNLPPIYEVHCKIKDRLERLANRVLQNDETTTVGDIYMDQTDALLKSYPPFVNFYEKTKDAIVNCDKGKPRFHAFLKIAQTKPECGRQTLVELLIRPVQRLPSTLLLLDDILKETPKTHKDHELLTKAIASLKEVMTHINEDKRKIENQISMFVLINDIENCPATLLSSHRTFLKKLDVYEMSNELLKKGAQLTLFLFTDCLEICKPRLKLLNAAKSPNSTKQRTPQKCYKHISLFSLNNITKVCDILQNNDDTDLFGILCRLAGEKDKFFSFKVIASNSTSTMLNNTSMCLQNQMNTTNSMCSSSSSYSINGSCGLSSSTTTSTLHNLPNNNSNGYSSTLSSTSSSNSSNPYSMYASSTNLNYNDENYQGQIEKKEYIKLLAQGICNVKCITEYVSGFKV